MKSGFRTYTMHYYNETHAVRFGLRCPAARVQLILPTPQSTKDVATPMRFLSVGISLGPLTGS